MATYIKQEFTKKYPFVITKDLYKAIKVFLLQFENREPHLKEFNSPLFATENVAFTTADQNSIYEILNVREKELSDLIKSIPTINNSFRVQSNPLNNILVWTIHRANVASRLNRSDTEDFIFCVGKILFYKYYTSLSRHYIKYRAKPEIMQAVIENLTRQSDIVRYGTWKLVIEESVRGIFLSRSSPHYGTLSDPRPDAGFSYIISDTQTRIREKVKNISIDYYKAQKDPRLLVKSRSAFAEGEDGEFLIETISSMDGMLTRTPKDVLNTRVFTKDRIKLKVVASLTNVSQSLLLKTIEAFSAAAISQSKLSKNAPDDKTMSFRGNKEYPIIEPLIKDTLLVFYHYARQKGISEKDKDAVLESTRRVIVSSRVSDEKILSVRDRMLQVITEVSNVSRPPTLSALRTGVILYIMLFSFENQ